MYGLAARLHMPAGRLLAEVSGREFAQWLAHFALVEQDNDPQAQALAGMGFQLE